MIFERAIRREFSHTVAGISVVLLAILLSTQLIRLLKDAAGGRIAPEAVISLLGFAALNYLPVMLSLALFVTIVLTLSRSYRDSEMVVWFSSGLRLTAWIRPVMRFSLPIIIAIAALSGILSPWASYNTSQYKEKLAARSDVSQVSPGAFREASKGQADFFVEALADDASKVGNVFVASLQEGKFGVVMSDSGHQKFAENGDRFVVLENGRRYELEPGSAQFNVMDFERYSVRVEDGEAKQPELIPSRLPLLELIQEDSLRSRAELLWRMSMPISAVILALMAIPLSYVNPRAGRSANLLIAILIYAVYNNLMSVSQAWVAQGKLSFGIAVWAVHVIMLVTVALMFYRRMALRMPWQRGVR